MNEDKERVPEDHQWAVEAEIYRRDGSVKRRAEFRTFATRADADAWLKDHLQQWRSAEVIMAYLARVCRWNNGQWVPVAVRHSCRRGVTKGGSR